MNNDPSSDWSFLQRHQVALEWTMCDLMNGADPEMLKAIRGRALVEEAMEELERRI